MSRGAKAGALVLGFLLQAAPARAQYRHRVVLLETPGDAASAEVPARLHGELTAAGFDVVALPVAAGDDLKRAAENAAGELHPAAVLYVVSPAPDDDSAQGAVWISDRLLHRTFVVRFRADAGAPSGEAANVAVQAIEILRADLAELSVTREVHREPSPPKPSPPPARERARSAVAPSPGARPEVQGGFGLLQGFAGVRSTWTPVLRAGTSLPAAWLDDAPVTVSVLASVAALGGEVRIEASEGAALVRQTLAGLDVVLRLAPREVVAPFFLVSGGAYAAQITGTGGPAVHARTTWSPASGGGVGVRAPLGAGFAVVVSGELSYAWSRTQIRIAERRVATAGAPLALLSAAAVGVF